MILGISANQWNKNKKSIQKFNKLWQKNDKVYQFLWRIQYVYTFVMSRGIFVILLHETCKLFQAAHGTLLYMFVSWEVSLNVYFQFYFLNTLAVFFTLQNSDFEKRCVKSVQVCLASD